MEVRRSQKRQSELAATETKLPSKRRSSRAKQVKTPVKIESSPNFPKGWQRKEVQRESGKTAGHVDVYIYRWDVLVMLEMYSKV